MKHERRENQIKRSFRQHVETQIERQHGNPVSIPGILKLFVDYGSKFGHFGNHGGEREVPVQQRRCIVPAVAPYIAHRFRLPEPVESGYERHGIL